MDFKLRRVKVIGSIVIPFLIWILVFMIGPLLKSPPSIIRNFLEIHNLGSLFSFGNISLFLIEILFVYLIWSLFQKK